MTAKEKMDVAIAEMEEAMTAMANTFDNYIWVGSHALKWAVKFKEKRNIPVTWHLLQTAANEQVAKKVESSKPMRLK